MNEVLEFLKKLQPMTVLKWASVIFVVCLQILLIISVTVALAEAWS